MISLIVNHVTNKKHEFQIIPPSPWPFATSLSLFIAMMVGVLVLHDLAPLWAVGAASLPLSVVIFYWCKDVIYEGQVAKLHTPPVVTAFKMGMLLFILSEAALFATFFWSFFNAWLGSKGILEFSDWQFVIPKWPPEGIDSIDPWDIPLVNTFILLLSGTSVTWAHHAILSNNKKATIQALSITVLLGLIFTLLQIFEYYHADFSFVEEGYKSIYSTNFYMITGFHGFHVLAGNALLFVCLIRTHKNHFSAKDPTGVELAAWYWHFVDVIWLLLFVFVYWLAS